MEIRPLNIFYEEPDPDRWIRFDRYPRRLIRTIVRGPQPAGGVMMVALQLMRGLERLKIPYRFNDYRYIKKHPEELACLIGKPQLLFERQWPNPVLFGAGVYSHPVECPDLFEKYPNVKKFLVPGEWMRKMCEPYYGNKVLSWAAGIDVDRWRPAEGRKTTDFLIYDKIRWDHRRFQGSLIQPILKKLDDHQLSYRFIKYGSYRHDELLEGLTCCKAVIFLCEHETQGLAYQQILATDTPVLAWDRGGYWQDPAYYPSIKYGPVSSVPYWDSRCGEKFVDAGNFEQALLLFTERLKSAYYAPRQYILDHLTLEKSAQAYLDIVASLNEDTADR